MSALTKVDAIPGMQPVEVGHGIGCVLLMLPSTDRHKPAATVLWAKQARELAALLTRQANYAEEALPSHYPEADRQDRSTP